MDYRTIGIHWDRYVWVCLKRSEETHTKTCFCKSPDCPPPKLQQTRESSLCPGWVCLLSPPLTEGDPWGSSPPPPLPPPPSHSHLWFNSPLPGPGLLQVKFVALFYSLPWGLPLVPWTNSTLKGKLVIFCAGSLNVLQSGKTFWVS